MDKYNSLEHVQMMRNFRDNFVVGGNSTEESSIKGWGIKDIDYVSSPVEDIEFALKTFTDVIKTDHLDLKNLTFNDDFLEDNSALFKFQRELLKISEKYHSDNVVMEKILMEINRKAIVELNQLKEDKQDFSVPMIRKDLQNILQSTMKVAGEIGQEKLNKITDYGLNKANIDLKESQDSMKDFNHVLNDSIFVLNEKINSIREESSNIQNNINHNIKDINLDKQTIENNNISIEYTQDRIKKAGIFDFSLKKALKQEIKSLQEENKSLNLKIFNNEELKAQSGILLEDVRKKEHMQNTIFGSVNDVREKVNEAHSITEQIQKNIYEIDGNLNKLNLLRSARKTVTNEFMRLEEQKKRGGLSEVDQIKYNEILDRRADLSQQENLLANKTRDIQKEKHKLEHSCALLKSEIKEAGKKIKKDIKEIENFGKSPSKLLIGNVLRGAKKSLSISSSLVKMVDSTIGLSIAATIGVAMPLMKEHHKDLIKNVLKNEFNRFKDDGKNLGGKLVSAIKNEELNKGKNKEKDDIDILSRGI